MAVGAGEITAVGENVAEVSAGGGGTGVPRPRPAKITRTNTRTSIAPPPTTGQNQTGAPVGDGGVGLRSAYHRDR